jgi:hypothetical protein
MREIVVGCNAPAHFIMQLGMMLGVCDRADAMTQRGIQP